MITFTSHSTAETEQFAAGFAAELRPGDVVACRGGMGMGKTAFARGLARGLGLVDDLSLIHIFGLNYVSCSPFRVPIARLAAAQAAIKQKAASEN